VFTSAFANAGHPQNFTADRGRLLAAIDQSFAVALHNPPYGPGHDPRNGNGVMIDDPEGYESGDCHCRVCGPETIGRVADAVRRDRPDFTCFQTGSEIAAIGRGVAAELGPLANTQGKPEVGPFVK
jgi:hypothetical protein